jgi:hypothetical protein
MFVAGADLVARFQLLVILILDAEGPADVIDHFLIGSGIVTPGRFIAAEIGVFPIGVDVAAGARADCPEPRRGRSLRLSRAGSCRATRVAMAPRLRGSCGCGRAEPHASGPWTRRPWSLPGRTGPSSPMPSWQAPRSSEPWISAPSLRSLACAAWRAVWVVPLPVLWAGSYAMGAYRRLVWPCCSPFQP